MMHVYFLRHFKTKNNICNILNGRSIDEPIIEGHNLEIKESINVIFCSTALRCQQTIDFYKINNRGKIIYLDQLLERDLGDMEGRSRTEMEKKFPQLFEDSVFKVFSTPPNGESYEKFNQRAIEFWEYCSQLFTGNVLICSHNQMLKMLYFVIKNEFVTMDKWKKIKFPYGEILHIV